MSNAASPKSKWPDIPVDILITITKSLKIYGDYIRIRSVCKNWRSILPRFPPNKLPTQLPWLLLPSSFPQHYPTTCSNLRNFYDLTAQKVYSLPLPEAYYPRRIVGSSHGYLVLVGDSPHIFCYNPLTNSKVFLAPLSTFKAVVSFSFSNVGREYSIQGPREEVYTLDLRQMRDVYIRKVILSAPPTEEGCIALAIVSCKVTGSTESEYFKCGEPSWKVGIFGAFPAEDVIYCQYERLFYAVKKGGDLAVFDLNQFHIIHSVDRIEGDLRYLVKYKGEILLVSRSLGAEVDVVAYCEVYQTTGFAVYRFQKKGSSDVFWEPVTDLGDWAVFVGENSTLAFSASHFPGCKGNCIYFTDDHSKSADVGVYDLGTGCIETLPCYPQDASLPLHWAPPIWFTPNPY